MKKHRVFLCDGKDGGLTIQKAIDWVNEDPENRSVMIQGKGNKTEIIQSSAPKKEAER